MSETKPDQATLAERSKVFFRALKASGISQARVLERSGAQLSSFFRWVKDEKPDGIVPRLSRLSACENALAEIIAEDLTRLKSVNETFVKDLKKGN